ncbi:MAG: dTDP-4-dehydrorhamnose reductase [Flavobacteriales bacterium]
MTHSLKHILVVGAGGQLGHALRSIATEFPEFRFTFWERADLDITVESWVKERIASLKPDIVINAAAYTNVERAEEDHEGARNGNALAPGYLAEACKFIEALLVHISTDYVFDGAEERPYTEEDIPHPLNQYGFSKLEGERAIDAVFDHYFILRTSWLYGTYGHNFYNMMLRLAKERGELNVVNDQFATPTWVGLLARDILSMLKRKYVQGVSIPCGLYHYTHDGTASWWDFANAIMEVHGMHVPVHAVDSNHFPTKAKRPGYSKLDNSKWKNATGLTAYTWQEALRQCCSVVENRRGV